jgi:hypothetical protein
MTPKCAIQLSDKIQFGDKIAASGLVVAVLTLFIAGLALWVAAVTLAKSNRNASAATVVALTEGFRESWARYFSAADVDEKRASFGDLINLIELACGLVEENTLTGVSKDIQENYLNSVLVIFERVDFMNDLISLKQDKTTFQHINSFVKNKSRVSDHPRLIAALAATVSQKE